MTTKTVFTADANPDSRTDAILDGYAALVDEAAGRGYNLDACEVSQAEPFASTDRGFLWISYLKGPLGLAVADARVYVK